MEILTAVQMRRVDSRAIRRHGLPGLVLMEHAGMAVVEALARAHPDLRNRRVTVVCGPGNNGGDGLVAARLLRARGVAARVVLAARAASLTGDARTNLRAAAGSGVPIEEAAGSAGWKKAIARGALRCDVLVDALLGTGLRGAARGHFARIIRDCNASGRPIVSADIPSGLSGDSELVPGPAMRAVRTVTFCRPKRPHLLPPGDAFVGALTVAPIGIPQAAVDPERAWLRAIDRLELPGPLPPRPATAHKGDFGRLLIVAGSRDRPGAAALAGQAALRAGCGLVTIATAASAQPVVSAHAAELMTASLPESADGTVAATALDAILALAEKAGVLAAGPGLGTGAGSVRLIRSLVARTRTPLVLDADAIGAFAGPAQRLLSGRLRTLVLTPHPGEMRRLLGITAAALAADRTGHARAFARRHRCHLVLKGHRTLVAAPDGRVFVNTTGNPAMATAGSGDVLTGFLAALLAQGADPLAACLRAVWLHGRAGDLAAKTLAPSAGRRTGAAGGLVAGDLISFWNRAVADLAGDPGGGR